MAAVKRAENSMIYDLSLLSKDVYRTRCPPLMAEYKISGIPVVDDNRYLVGDLVTNRDLRFERNMDEKRIGE